VSHVHVDGLRLAYRETGLKGAPEEVNGAMRAFLVQAEAAEVTGSL
jgi:hypothetical protein